MEWHPFAKLFPMLGDEAIEALAEDIRQNGQRTPIVVDTHERIIDGRNRSAACTLANVNPVCEVFHGDDKAILKLVCSLNIHRRHLSDSQRDLIAAQISTTQIEPSRSRSKKTTDAPIGASCQVTQDEAAELLNVKKRSVQRASKVIADAIPEVQKDVADGKIKLAKAEKVSRLAPAEQQKARAANYKETPVETTSSAMKFAKQAVTILGRIRDDDDRRREAFEFVAEWVEQHFPA